MFNQSFFKCNIKLMCSFFFTVTRGNNLFVIVSFCFVYIKDLSADSRGILIAGYDHSLQLRLMSLNALLVFLSTTSSVLRAWPLISDLSWRPFYYLLFCECFVKHTSGIISDMRVVSDRYHGIYLQFFELLRNKDDFDSKEKYIL